MISGWGGRVRGLFNDTKGPWGPKGSGDEPEQDSGGPWGQTPGERRKRSRRASDDSVSALDDLIRRSRLRWSPGGGLPGARHRARNGRHPALTRDEFRRA